MVDYVVVTNTRWNEAPRIRHQVTHLLLSSGSRVHFVERSESIGSAELPAASEPVPGLTVVRTRHLLHQQLRVLRPSIGSTRPSWFRSVVKGRLAGGPGAPSAYSPTARTTLDWVAPIDPPPMRVGARYLASRALQFCSAGGFTRWSGGGAGYVASTAAGVSLRNARQSIHGSPASADEEPSL
jgi:hypothetical protein